jgi:hypothetical protein
VLKNNTLKGFDYKIFETTFQHVRYEKGSYVLYSNIYTGSGKEHFWLERAYADNKQDDFMVG